MKDSAQGQADKLITIKRTRAQHLSDKFGQCLVSYIARSLFRSFSSLDSFCSLLFQRGGRTWEGHEKFVLANKIQIYSKFKSLRKFYRRNINIIQLLYVYV